MAVSVEDYDQEEYEGLMAADPLDDEGIEMKEVSESSQNSRAEAAQSPHGADAHGEKLTPAKDGEEKFGFRRIGTKIQVVLLVLGALGFLLASVGYEVAVDGFESLFRGRDEDAGCPIAPVYAPTMITTCNETKADEPNNMEMWPPSVLIFDESMSAEEIKAKIAPTTDTFNPNATYQGDDAGTAPNPIPTYSSKEKHFASGAFPAPHFALLFMPGTYKNVDFEVGYYVQMAGLGPAADDVKFVGERSGPFVPALNKDLKKEDGGTIQYPGSGLSLDTFWRSAENFYTSTSGRPETCWVDGNGNGMVWAVSQAAPLRRAHIDTDLWLHDAGAFASGGFLANSKVEGKTYFGSQQQWVSRNVHFVGGDEKAKNERAAWSSVYVGCTGDGVPPHGIFDVMWEGQSVGKYATTVVDPEIRVEKPFVTYEEGRFKLRVPAPLRNDVVGPHLAKQDTDNVRDFNMIKLAIPNPPKDIDDVENYNKLDSDDERLTQELQAALDEGKDLVLSPGSFFLTESLEVHHPNQVILGLGLATLVAPQDGTPCIRVKRKTPGVRIAGLLLEASVQRSKTTSTASLLEIGERGIDDAGKETNPIVLSDIFARVGGANLDRTVSTDVMVRIHSGNVVGDNLWLWRADHVRLRPPRDGEPAEKPNDPKFPYFHQTENGECPVQNALSVNGNDVTIFGLFCEHTLQHQLVWHGNNGTVYFYQSELPYDVYHEEFDGYVGYFVNNTVSEHRAKGLGVYSNFVKDDVAATTGIVHPTMDGVEHIFTVFLNNKGSIKTVLNEELGKEVNKDFKGPSFVLEKN